MYQIKQSAIAQKERGGMGKTMYLLSRCSADMVDVALSQVHHFLACEIRIGGRRGERSSRRNDREDVAIVAQQQEAATTITQD